MVIDGDCDDGDDADDDDDDDGDDDAATRRHDRRADQPISQSDDRDFSRTFMPKHSALP